MTGTASTAASSDDTGPFRVLQSLQRRSIAGDFISAHFHRCASVALERGDADSFPGQTPEDSKESHFFRWNGLTGFAAAIEDFVDIKPEPLIEPHGGFVFGGDFKSSEVHAALQKTVGRLQHEGFSDSLTSMFGDHANILNGADGAQAEDSLDGADVGRRPIRFGLVNHKPG